MKALVIYNAGVASTKINRDMTHRRSLGIRQVESALLLSYRTIRRRSKRASSPHGIRVGELLVNPKMV